MTALARHVFVVAEAGSNWRVGSPADDREMGHKLIRAAREAGADAVKFQTFRASTTYAPEAGQIGYLSGAGVTGSINELFRDLEMPYDLVAEFGAYAASAGIEFMSSPFSVEDLAAVDPFVVRHKLASYEISHVRLLEAMARTGKPLLISTGAATYDDITFALATAHAAGAGDITLLQCTAKYPAPLDRINLNVIPTLRTRFGTKVGLSDHSRDPRIAPLGAVALGATVIEKHFTIDRSLPGPDHRFAIEADELKGMVDAIRSLEQALGVDEKAVSDVEEELAAFAVRRLQAVSDIAAGEELIEGRNFDVLRPGSRSRGLHPRYLSAIGGRRAARAIPAGDGITGADVDPPLVTSDDGT
jgi:sialic acid synthase SpsE